MVHLLQLPPEIIDSVGYRLEPTENRKLRLVCQQIRPAIEPRAFEALHLTTQDLPLLLERLEAYASGATRAGLFVRTVVICIPFAGQTTETESLKLEKLFQSAIFSLRNVKAISWVSGELDPHWIVDFFAEYIQSIALDHFNINIRNGTPNWGAFRTIQNLRSFTFQSWPLAHVGDIYHASQIVLNSPRLSTLEISTFCFTATSTAPRLHDFLPPRGCNSLPLESVNLDCLRIFLDVDTLPHFRSLKHLKIRNNLITPEFGSTYTQIWDTLRQENVHLTAIDVNLGVVEQGLMAYLMSYQGIKSLTFNSELQWYDSEKADTVAQRFFTDVIPTICHSLERLVIDSHISTGWCLGKRNGEAFKRCKRLKELHVSISGVDETTDLFEEVSSEMVFLERRTTSKAVSNAIFLAKTGIHGGNQVSWIDPWRRRR